MVTGGLAATELSILPTSAGHGIGDADYPALAAAALADEVLANAPRQPDAAAIAAILAAA